MPARPPDTLERMIVGIAVLNGLHVIDHVLRGDFHWPIDDQSISFIVVIVVSLLILLMLAVLLATVQTSIY